jgi:hypothetical protein
MTTNVIAVFVNPDSQHSTVVETKRGLKALISTSAETVKFVPIPVVSDPAHEAVRGSAVWIPAGTPVTVHSPTNRKWSATVSRTESNVFSVK